MRLTGVSSMRTLAPTTSPKAGWNRAANPLTEYQSYVEKYGESSAEWIMDQQYQNYKRLVLVAHTQEELESLRPEALEVARIVSAGGCAMKSYRAMMNMSDSWSM